MSLLFTLLFIIVSIGISISVAYVSLRFTGYTFNRRYIYFGMAIFFIGITLHSFIALPVVVSEHGVKAFLKIFDKSELKFKLWELFYFAAAAGVGQEFSKALPIMLELRRTERKNPTPPYFYLGLNIGLGFSLSEIVFIGITNWSPHITGIAFNAILIGCFERLGATLFHMATGGLIAFGLEKRKMKYFLLLSIVLHALLNAFVSFTYKTQIVSNVAEEVILFSFSFLLLFLGIFFTRRVKGNVIAK